MTERDQTSFSLTGNFTARYFVRKGAKSGSHSPVFFLLHGYSQTGETFIEKLLPAFSPEVLEAATLVAPNGPFPVPEYDDGVFKPGFSWYFYETKSDAYYVDMKLGIDYVKSLVDHLDLAARPKILIGYSQGGYIVPFAAQALQRVKHIIGVNCQFLREEIEGALPCSMDQVQGSDDKMVSAKIAKEYFEKLKPRNKDGRYVEVTGAGHGLSGAILAEVKKLVDSAWASI